MRKVFVAIVVLLFFQQSYSQVTLPVYHDSVFSTYFHQRWSLFQLLPQTKGDVIFIGNSITDGSEWSELFNDVRIKNRGISGDISAGVIKRITEVVKRKPAKVFLMIGVNDLARGISPDSVVKNILLLVAYIKQESPSTKLFVQSIFPVNALYGKFDGHTGKTDQIKLVNKKLADKAQKHHYTFLDLYPSFCNREGKLNPEYTNDGLHLTGEGYLLWKHLVFPFVYDLQQKPSLISLPQEIKWMSGYFPLYNCRSIVVTDKNLEKEATFLTQIIRELGWNVELANTAKPETYPIELKMEKTEPGTQNNEAYKLKVTANSILLTAGTAHGIFNGIQTLKQLMRDGVMVDACEISDWPAFSWRGYMIDVGRNYMSPALLKQQIDVMAMYKFNVFHFHPTEDIAWRIAIKQYPQLTAPENMLRNKGLYYSESEIKDLIDYCKQRHITFVPEIDMPGHSAAFKRAMKTDMQTDSVSPPFFLQG